METILMKGGADPEYVKPSDPNSVLKLHIRNFYCESCGHIWSLKWCDEENLESINETHVFCPECKRVDNIVIECDEYKFE